MTRYDVFNGDADGICALHQLRLAEPAEAELVTGVKRDIDLLKYVNAGPGDRITVLDISLDKNRADLLRLLDAGAQVRYFDHHFGGAIPQHPALESTIDPRPDTCTSLLVDDHLNGAFRAWAVVGAFGDNFDERARERAWAMGLDGAQAESLKELGILLNYNGYGVEPADLFFHPADLYRRVRSHVDPFTFIAQDMAFRTLKEGYRGDMDQVGSLQPKVQTAGGAVYILPDTAWARRVSGVFANDLARNHPDRAHALLTELPGGIYRVSVRAPLNNKTGADTLCRAFPTGGGRAAAAGINELPEGLFEAFVGKFAETYG